MDPAPALVRELGPITAPLFQPSQIWPVVSLSSSPSRLSPDPITSSFHSPLKAGLWPFIMASPASTHAGQLSRGRRSPHCPDTAEAAQKRDSALHLGSLEVCLCTGAHTGPCGCCPSTQERAASHREASWSGHMPPLLDVDLGTNPRWPPGTCRTHFLEEAERPISPAHYPGQTPAKNPESAAELPSVIKHFPH